MTKEYKYKLAYPLSVAKIFLAHSCKDHKYTNKLSDKLKKNFNVYYDTYIGGRTLDKQAIEDSDIFLFIASAHSFDRKSFAYKELEYVDDLPYDIAPRVNFVVLENYEIPRQFKGRKHLDLSWDNIDKDLSRVSEELHRELIRSGGFYESPETRESDIEILGGKNPELIVDKLSAEKIKGVYLLNAIVPYYEMNRIVEYIKKLDRKNRENVLDNLIKIFIDYESNSNYIVARQNAIIIASKIAVGERELIKVFKKQYPDTEISFLFRGFHVALGLLGDREIILEYTYNLEHVKEKEWDRQRLINIRFHEHYYKGRYPAIYRLRESIENITPENENLLTLNVYTLGMLSSYKKDIELLEKHRLILVECGVNPGTINSTIENIRKKINKEK